MIELEIFLKIGSPVQSNSSLLIFAAEHASVSVPQYQCKPHQRLYVRGPAVSITRRATHHPPPANRTDSQIGSGHQAWW